MEIGGRAVRVTLDDTTGSLIGWSYDGVEFLKPGVRADLFAASFRDTDGEQSLVRASQSLLASLNAVRGHSGEQTLVTAVFNTPIPGIQAEVRLHCESERLAADCTIWNDTDLRLEWVELPGIRIPDYFRASGGDGAILWPAQEGVLVDDPALRNQSFLRYRESGYPAHGWSGYYPSSCQMQFMAVLRGERGMYIGCHDTGGHVKFLEYYVSAEDEVSIQLRLYTGGAGREWRMPYQVVIEPFQGDWHDAATIYRRWVHEYGLAPDRSLAEQNEVPEWAARGAVAVCYPVRGRGQDRGEMDFNEYYPYREILPVVRRLSAQLGAPIIAIAMHWEGTAPWAPPYVWPPAGSEDDFRHTIERLHSEGHYFGVYCSGTGWTQRSMIDRGYDRSRDFEEMHGERMACRGPRNEMYALICNGDNAQRWGYDMCAAADGVARIVADEICKIADAGCDYIQFFDQNLGGITYLCYADDHGHPPSPGAWEVPAVRALMRTVHAALDDRGRRPVIGCEAAAAEPFLDLFRFNDLRANISFLAGRPVPAYSFVYHPYVANFSGNQNPSAGVIDVRRSPENLLLRTALAFVAGDAITVTLGEGGRIHWNWGAPWTGPLPDQDSIATLIRNLNELRTGVWRDYLLHGRMEKPFPVECSEYELHFTSAGRVQQHPAVLTSRWSSGGGEVQLLVNFRHGDETARIRLPEDVGAWYHPHAGAPPERIVDGLVTVRGLSAGVVELPEDKTP